MRGRNSVLSVGVMVLWCGLSILHAEPSVYGFDTGGKTAKENKKAIAALRRQVAMQKERIDGLTTVIEGLSATVNELQQRSETSSQGSSTDQTALLKELGNMIDHINANYVSKAELKKILANGGKMDTAISTEAKAESKPKKEKLIEKQSASKLYGEGVRLFQKKRYDEAKKRFEITDTKGYKPAASNYYLGEIAYYTKHYDDAIFYFKKSAGLYDQAGYIDTLLLHTAVSLEKTGDKKQAKRFYENIVANYPGRKTAEIAKSKLKRL